MLSLFAICKCGWYLNAAYCADEQKQKHCAEWCQQSGEDQDRAVAHVGDDPAGAQIEKQATDACSSSPQPCYRADGRLRKEIARQRLHIRNPHLKAEENDGDTDQRGIRPMESRSQDAEWHKTSSGADDDLPSPVNRLAARDQATCRPASEERSESGAKIRRPLKDANILERKMMDILQIRWQP